MRRLLWLAAPALSCALAVACAGGASEASWSRHLEGVGPDRVIESADEVGRVRLVCDPADAEVLVDGVSRGLASDFAAPASLRLPAGEYALELRKEGHATLRRRLRVLGGSIETLTVSLSRLPEGPREHEE